MTHYELKKNIVYYNDRGMPFTLLAKSGRDNEAGIPLIIKSADDIDLDAVAEELSLTVHNRGNSRRKPARDRWNLSIEGTTPEAADELNAKLKAEKLEQYGHFKPTIVISGTGVTIIYEMK